MKRSNSQANALSPLLTTNLHIPTLHGEVIFRRILVEKMDQAFHFPLTLISAPAGFGKTTLLSQWIAGSQHKDFQKQIAWVTLERDFDLSRFCRYLLTALEGIHPGIGPPALALLDTPQPPIQSILSMVINDLAALDEDVFLILDDYDHVDDPAIHTTLSFFINHLPPKLHLVVAGRSYPPLPLARWRASRQLYELREEDLRFTPQEIALFLNETKGLQLSADEISALSLRTEGWIAGLQLVALSLQSSDEAAKRNFVSAFTGSQRYILDYLVEEVLQQQPQEIRTFLLQTSVLEYMHAELCNAVTGQNNAQSVLEQLVRGQLFTIPLDGEGHWYRYHHLFRDVLRHRLQQTQPDMVLELHRRAATWYLQAGQTDHVIRHACLAQAWNWAVELIEPAISTAWSQGEIRKIITWLDQLPVAYLDARPHLSLYYSRALLLGGQLKVAEQRLREAEGVLRRRIAGQTGVQASREERLLLGTICAFRTTIAAVTGETASALLLGEEALNLLPLENIDIRAHALNSLGVNAYFMGEMCEAVRLCSEAGALAQQAGNHYLQMVAIGYQAKARVCQGQLREAGEILNQALQWGDTPRQPVRARLPAAGVVCAGFGALLYEWGRLAEAERILVEAIELGQRLAFGSALWEAYHSLARTRLARGDAGGAMATLEEVERYARTHSVPLPERLMEAEQARAWLALGEMEPVEQWARACRSERIPSPGLVEEIEQMTLAHLELLQGHPEQALGRLNRVRPPAEAGGRKGHSIEILLLTAMAQHAQGDTRLAVNTLHAALTAAEPEGYLRTFVDAGRPVAELLYQALRRGVFPEYVTRLLAGFPEVAMIPGVPAQRPVPRNSQDEEQLFIEPLSQRELEVLHLMAGGASNQEIAEALTIALTTAKKHVSNIIQKLGAENRVQAVAKGRSLGLLK